MTSEFDPVAETKAFLQQQSRELRHVAAVMGLLAEANERDGERLLELAAECDKLDADLVAIMRTATSISRAGAERAQAATQRMSERK